MKLRNSRLNGGFGEILNIWEINDIMQRTRCTSPNETP